MAASAAAGGAAYANRNQYNNLNPGMVNGYWHGNDAGLVNYNAARGVAPNGSLPVSRYTDYGFRVVRGAAPSP